MLSSAQIAEALALSTGDERGFELERVLFDKQLPFGLSRARYQTACCTRRSGKTVGELTKLLDIARDKPDSVSLYITLSRINAKRLAWEILKTLNAEHNVGGIPSEGELLLTLPNGARIYLTGCSDMGEVEKFRGLPLAIVVIDEAQSFPTMLLQRLIDEVLVPALMDFNGALVLVGTPGPVPIGYFHDCVVSPEWAHFSWSVFDNPWIERKSGRTARAMLDDELKRRGVDENDPVIQREWFGRWVLDPNVLVFRYDSKRNDRKPLVHQHHVIGVDFGYYDADAIAVLGWSDSSPCLDLVEELVTAKQHITPLMESVRAMESKYKPLAIVADFAALGMKIAEEISMRTSVPVEAADKMRKLEHIEWLNDAMRTDKFFAPSSSRFAQDCALVEWDRSKFEKPKISDRFHSDICDAVLYAYVKALHWLHVPAPPQRARFGTVEWHAEEQLRQQQQLDADLEAELDAARERRQQSEELADLF